MRGETAKLAAICRKHLLQAKTGRDCEQCILELGPSTPLKIWVIMHWSPVGRRWLVWPIHDAVSLTEAWGKEKLRARRIASPSIDFKLEEFKCAKGDLL